uniref:Uncharacterized protein n=1 Tax=Angiostrongylus cantonensis TaxID=6313 RepID=A0A0K0DP89_ANGCA
MPHNPDVIDGEEKEIQVNENHLISVFRNLKKEFGKLSACLTMMRVANVHCSRFQQKEESDDEEVAECGSKAMCEEFGMFFDQLFFDNDAEQVSNNSDDN